MSLVLDVNPLSQRLFRQTCVLVRLGTQISHEHSQALRKRRNRDVGERAIQKVVEAMIRGDDLVSVVRGISVLGGDVKLRSPVKGVCKQTTLASRMELTSSCSCLGAHRRSNKWPFAIPRTNIRRRSCFLPRYGEYGWRANLGSQSDRLVLAGGWLDRQSATRWLQLARVEALRA